MIRKTIIVLLTLGAGTTGFGAVLSYAGVELWRSKENTAPSRFGLSDGQLYVEIRQVLESRPAEGGFEWSWRTPGAAEYFVGIHQMYYGTAVIDWHDDTSMHQTFVAVPLAPCCVLLAIYPAVAFIRGPFRRWRRRRKGLCLRCGYDLTGNVSGVCPECGVEV